MKNLITAIFLLFSLAMIGQDWQLDGTKYPNATNQGDTVSLATKVPLWDADNLQNYFADLGDILALNPVPPTPTLQSVTSEGNTSQNAIRIHGFLGYNDQSGLWLTGSQSSGTGAIFNSNGTGALPENRMSQIDLTPSHLKLSYRLSGISIGEETSSTAGVQSDYRMSIPPALNEGDAVPLGQMLDSIGVYSMTEGANTGYVTKFRRDNPSFYGPLGAMAIDFSIGGGPSETLGATGAYSVAIGALATASNTFSTVIGGSENISSGNTSTVVGGLSNSSTARESAILGGRDNQASGERSAILGGNNNNATDTHSAIVGGVNNTATKQLAVVIGGENNASSGNQSAIIGGLNNTTTGTYSASIGGSNNEATGLRSVTISGNNSVASGNESIVIGGFNNYARSYNEVVTGYHSTDYVPTSTGQSSPYDRLFNIGNGTSITSSDAFTILKNGQTGIGIDNFEANTTGELLQVNGNIDITPSGGALLLRSPDGTVYELKVDNSGTLTVTPQ